MTTDAPNLESIQAAQQLGDNKIKFNMDAYLSRHDRMKKHYHLMLERPYPRKIAFIAQMLWFERGRSGEQSQYVVEAVRNSIDVLYNFMNSDQYVLQIKGMSEKERRRRYWRDAKQKQRQEEREQRRADSGGKELFQKPGRKSMAELSAEEHDEEDSDE